MRDRTAFRHKAQSTCTSSWNWHLVVNSTPPTTGRAWLAKRSMASSMLLGSSLLSTTCTAAWYSWKKSAKSHSVHMILLTKTLLFSIFGYVLMFQSTCLEESSSSLAILSRFAIFCNTIRTEARKLSFATSNPRIYCWESLATLSSLTWASRKTLESTWVKWWHFDAF